MELRRLPLILALLINHLLVAGQIENQLKLFNSVSQMDDHLQFVAEQMPVNSSVSNEQDWCYRKNQPNRILGIRHQPTRDFNIYLTYRHKLNFFAEAAIEISLNNSGVVNLRSLIALRKKGDKTRTLEL